MNAVNRPNVKYPTFEFHTSLKLNVFRVQLYIVVATLCLFEDVRGKNVEQRKCASTLRKTKQ